MIVWTALRLRITGLVNRLAKGYEEVYLALFLDAVGIAGAGDVDAFPGFQAPELVARLKKDARFAVVVGTTEGEVIMATNNGTKPFRANLRLDNEGPWQENRWSANTVTVKPGQSVVIVGIPSEGESHMQAELVRIIP